jgi:hypothetical protein
MTAMRIVRVHNEGDEDWTLKFDLNDTQIPVGGSAIVPFEAAAFWFGHPAAKGDGRRDELLRKKAQWGFLEGFDVEVEKDVPAFNPENKQSWEAKCPKFRVTHVDDENERVWMVLDDPTGSHAIGNVPAATDDVGVLRNEVAELKNMLASALNALQAATGTTSAPDPSTLPVSAPPDPAPGPVGGTSGEAGTRSDVQVPKSKTKGATADDPGAPSVTK